MAAFRPGRNTAGNLSYDFLPPQAAKPGPRPRAVSPANVTDADFVVLPKAGRPERRPPRPAAIETPAARRTGHSRPVRLALNVMGMTERVLGAMTARSFGALVVTVFLLIFSLSGGVDGLVNAMFGPALARHPIDITHVTLTPRDQNGMQILLLNAILENRTAAPLAPRRVRADLVSADRVVASMLIDLPDGTIDAGKSRGFSARLAHPGGKTPEIRLSLDVPLS